jgi:hypothetical protein
VRLRALGWGLLAVAAYLGAAAATLGPGKTAVRPVFDGAAPPQPYAWVNPPPDVADANVAPEGVEDDIPLRVTGSVAASVTTPDAQASLSVGAGKFAPQRGQRAIQVTIEPLDPATLGLEPPAGLEYAGNAYRIEAAYVPSGNEADLAGDASVVLRYPTTGERLVRMDGERWTDLESQIIHTSLLSNGATDRLGVFVVVGRPLAAAPGGSSLWRTVLISAGAAALAAALAVAVRLRSRRSGPGARSSSRPAASKATVPKKRQTPSRSRPKGRGKKRR